jgi:hypothetical protein
MGFSRKSHAPSTSALITFFLGAQSENTASIHINGRTQTDLSISTLIDKLARTMCARADYTGLTDDRVILLGMLEELEAVDSWTLRVRDSHHEVEPLWIVP